MQRRTARPDAVVFPSEPEFLEALRKFFVRETSKNVYPGKVLKLKTLWRQEDQAGQKPWRNGSLGTHKLRTGRTGDNSGSHAPW